jgi:adenosylcobinamide-phosphate synthase
VVTRAGTRGRHAAGVAQGLLADRLVGEPPDGIHPVAGFGALMSGIEARVYRDDRSAGVLYAATGLAIGALAGGLVRRTEVAVAVAAAGRELRTAAASVRDALFAGEIERARHLVPALVGRDPDALDGSELAAATIESLAENTVDAVVAPAVWALAAGAVGAFAYRAVNTMDAMVGHRSERYARFGWAAARLDDLANFVPARLTALLVVCVRPRAARAIRRAIREQAPAHPSPNAGVAEAAFAAALGRELGGPLAYGGRRETRPRLGWGPRPAPADVDAAITLASHVELALVALCAAIAVLPGR